MSYDIIDAIDEWDNGWNNGDGDSWYEDYSDVLDLPVEQWQQEIIGGIIFTPSNLLDYMKLVQTGYLTLEQEIEGSDASEDFKRAWALLLNAWNEFFEDNSQSGLYGSFKRGFSTTAQLAESYERKLYERRDQFQKLGGKSQLGALSAHLRTQAPSPWVGIALLGAGLIVGLIVRRS